MLALPDYNAALKPLRGRLPTPKLLGFLPYLLGWKWPPRCRIITLGVKEKYRTRGLAALMLTEGFKRVSELVSRTRKLRGYSKTS